MACHFSLSVNCKAAMEPNVRLALISERHKATGNAAIKLLIAQAGMELSWDLIVLLSHSRIGWESYA
jgi:hypothetical protein